MEYADDNAGFKGALAAVLDDDVDGVVMANDAVAMDSRDRTRSKGYVVQTDVIPARAPLASRLGVSNSFVPCRVKNCIAMSGAQAQHAIIFAPSSAARTS